MAAEPALSPHARQGGPWLRRASWAVFALSLAAPMAWARTQWQAFAADRPGPGCGLPVLGILATSLLAAGLLSAVASVCAGLAWRRLPSPRGPLRALEWTAVSAPAALAVLGLVALLVIG